MIELVTKSVMMLPLPFSRQITCAQINERVAQPQKDTPPVLNIRKKNTCRRNR